MAKLGSSHLKKTRIENIIPEPGIWLDSKNVRIEQHYVQALISKKAISHFALCVKRL